MISWITSFIYNTIYSGPARNAPNDGINIKKYIDEKPPEVKLISGDDLIQIKQQLKKVEEQPIKTMSFFSISQKDLLQAKSKLNKVNQKHTIEDNQSPLQREFNAVFQIGYKNYFEQKKKQCHV
jgi:hypothetical protein